MPSGQWPLKLKHVMGIQNKALVTKKKSATALAYLHRSSYFLRLIACTIFHVVIVTPHQVTKIQTLETIPDKDDASRTSSAILMQTERYRITKFLNTLTVHNS
jgi:hypothetical protein